MRIGIGNTVPERVNLPGQSGGGPLVLSYSSSAFCANASDPTPTVTGNVGAGTYSSTAGIIFADSGTNTNSATGVVDISASTPSATPYVITYTDTNSATATFNLTINALDNAAFSYTYSSYAQNFPDPTPTITGLAGGTFSAGSGLVFVDSGSNTGSSTGEIDLSASTIASYTITYTTTGTCPNTSTQTVGITAELAQVNNVYSMEFDGVNDFINLGNSDDLSFSTNTTNDSPFSISGWVKPDDTTTFRFIRKGPFNLGTGYEYIVSTNANNNLNFLIYDRVNNRIGTSTSAAITSTDWQHWVVTYDGTGKATGTNSGMKTYINGSLVATGDASSGNYIGMTNGSANLNIGISFGNSGFSYADGKMDEIGIFNVELTAQEVQSIYLATETGKTADLDDLTTPPVKWYRMGD